MPKIGPTFAGELAAARCLNGVSWDPEGGTLAFTGLDADQEAAATAVLDVHDPTKPPPAPPRQQLGTVFLAAVVDLGWWAWMDQGAAAQVAAGKPLDGRYWTAIGKADLVLVTDAKLTRVAKAAEAARVAASGQPAPAAPLITIAVAMDRGDAMLKAGT